MKIQSDKKRVIYNIIPCIYFDKKNFNTIEKLSIDLSLTSNRNRNWIFYSKLISMDNFTNEIYLISQKRNNLTLIYLDNPINRKNFRFILKIFYTFGKKVILLSNKKILHKYKNQEFIYIIKKDINNFSLKKNIFELLETI
jgi:hypothetical protein